MPISVTHPLVNNKTYTFVIDNSVPVVSKGDSKFEYVYSCDCGSDVMNMQVLMVHNASGVPELLDTLTLAGIDYIPFVCKLARSVKEAPAKVLLTPRDDNNSYHMYDIEIA